MDSWKEALDQEGSNYFGHVSKAFDDYDFADMEVRSDLADDNRFLLAKEKVFYISYLEKGGKLKSNQFQKKCPSDGLIPKPENTQWKEKLPLMQRLNHPIIIHGIDHRGKII